MISLVFAASCFAAMVTSHVLAFRYGWTTLRLGSVGRVAGLWLAVLAGLLAARPGVFPLCSLIVYAFFSYAYANQIQILDDLSPSLEILRLAASRGGEALTETELRGRFTDQAWILPRMDALVRTGYLEKSGGVYVMRPRAWLASRALGAYREFMRRSPGG